jgi:tripartite-type tricarboxylate transporter receptor subunit TctC
MRIFATLLTGLSVLLLPAPVAAQDFPNKPIKLIVPFPAGPERHYCARGWSAHVGVDQATGIDR